VSGFLAIDIGGTKIAAGVVSADGELMYRQQVPTPASGVWEALSSLVRQVLDSAEMPLVACGEGVGGPMTPGGETVSTLLIPEGTIASTIHMPRVGETDDEAELSEEEIDDAVAEIQRAISRAARLVNK
jgi:hypothetical protein